MDEEENKNYITSKIHPIFEKLVIDLLLGKPEDPVKIIKNKANLFFLLNISLFFIK
jgi:hypothetical protein